MLPGPLGLQLLLEVDNVLWYPGLLARPLLQALLLLPMALPVGLPGGLGGAQVRTSNCGGVRREQPGGTVTCRARYGKLGAKYLVCTPTRAGVLVMVVGTWVLANPLARHCSKLSERGIALDPENIPTYKIYLKSNFRIQSDVARMCGVVFSVLCSFVWIKKNK